MFNISMEQILFSNNIGHFFLNSVCCISGGYKCIYCLIENVYKLLLKTPETSPFSLGPCANCALYHLSNCCHSAIRNWGIQS